jgi:molecular chaperone GrpE
MAMVRKSKMMNDDPRTAAEETPPPDVEQVREDDELEKGAEGLEGVEVAIEAEEDPSTPEEEPGNSRGEPTDPEAAGGSPDGPDLEMLTEPPPVDEFEAIQEELRVLRDRHLRLAADFENYRKRVSADLVGGWVRAQADLVRTLTEGLDDLQRVSQLTSEDTTVDALIEGVDLVERKLLKALTDAGLNVLDPQEARFDPNTMEAMMRVPSEEEGQDDMVHQVFQKGYLFKDQLVRPARVSVYKDDD